MCTLSNLNKMATSMQHWQCVLLFLVLVGKFRLVLALIKLAVLMHSCYNFQAPFLIPSSEAFLLFICRVHKLESDQKLGLWEVWKMHGT